MKSFTEHRATHFKTPYKKGRATTGTTVVVRRASHATVVQLVPLRGRHKHALRTVRLVVVVQSQLIVEDVMLHAVPVGTL